MKNREIGGAPRDIREARSRRVLFRERATVNRLPRLRDGRLFRYVRFYEGAGPAKRECQFKGCARM